MTPPLDPEYHAARLLLLIKAVSTRTGHLEGLTKLAKLDFLVRYPDMLRRLLVLDGVDISALDGTEVLPRDAPVESRMIRYKYGPWDNLYYPLIGALVAKGLVEIVEHEATISLRPTSFGNDIASALAEDEQWAQTAARCDLAADHFNLTDSTLKNRIYADLPDVVDRPHREVI